MSATCFCGAEVEYPEYTLLCNRCVADELEYDELEYAITHPEGITND